MSLKVDSVPTFELIAGHAGRTYQCYLFLHNTIASGCHVSTEIQASHGPDGHRQSMTLGKPQIGDLAQGTNIEFTI